MTKDAYPYVAECGFCGNGLVRPFRCGDCETIVAICDECELIWKNIRTIAKNPNAKSSGAFPACPNCKAAEPDWYYVDRIEMDAEGFGDYIVGESP